MCPKKKTQEKIETHPTLATAASSPIHGHSVEEVCWVRAVRGTLTHTLYNDARDEVMSFRLTPTR